VLEGTLLEAASLFDGLWQLMLTEPVVELEKQTPEKRKASLLAGLAEFSDAVHKLLPKNGGVGHNGPPEDVLAITDDEKHVLLRATVETKLAVLSSDYQQHVSHGKRYLRSPRR
jgi:hypothetical protein